MFGCIFVLVGMVFALVALILLLFTGHQMLEQQGYQLGQCTITAKQLQSEVAQSTLNGHTILTDEYAPTFEYTVHTAKGLRYTGSGYNGLSIYTSDRAGQQAIVDHYAIGQSYSCWYDPADPTQAILVRPELGFVFLFTGSFLLFGILFVLLGILVLLGLFRTLVHLP
jgi:hypothetical protein